MEETYQDLEGVLSLVAEGVADHQNEEMKE